MKGLKYGDRVLVFPNPGSGEIHRGWIVFVLEETERYLVQRDNAPMDTYPFDQVDLAKTPPAPKGTGDAGE